MASPGHYHKTKPITEITNLRTHVRKQKTNSNNKHRSSFEAHDEGAASSDSFRWLGCNIIHPRQGIQVYISPTQDHPDVLDARGQVLSMLRQNSGNRGGCSGLNHHLKWKAKGHCTPKQKSCHFNLIFVIRCPPSCIKTSYGAVTQWGKFRQNGDFSVSVYVSIRTYFLWCLCTHNLIYKLECNPSSPHIVGHFEWCHYGTER